MTLPARGACALVCLWLAGCAAIGSREAILEGVDPARVELESTPFFPQSDYQCGPAALATVLAADGVDVTADQLVSEVYLPGRRGSLQVELIAATRALMAAFGPAMLPAIAAVPPADIVAAPITIKVATAQATSPCTLRALSFVTGA